MSISVFPESDCRGRRTLKERESGSPAGEEQQGVRFRADQSHYYKSGTGSGGMVNVTKVTGILDALLEDPDVRVHSEVLETYRAWEEKNPFNEGIGWGNEPWSQEEMPLDEALLEKAARTSETALVIIGRTAGEEQDSRDMPGSYRLSELEAEMIAKVRKAFSKMVVILNVGSIIDMSFVAEYAPDAVLYAWQGGMVGGLGTVDVLTGRVSPSGKLSDTIAHKIEDYPAHPYFGDPVRNFYAEDIYVGYRYFETFAPEKVLYPFGFGLSYTTFSREKILFEKCEGGFCFRVLIRNTEMYPARKSFRSISKHLRVFLESRQDRFWPSRKQRNLCPAKRKS
jgi:beta-glucosidase